MERNEAIAEIRKIRDRLLTEDLSRAERAKLCGQAILLKNAIMEDQPVSRVSTADIYTVREKGESRQKMNEQAVALIEQITKEGRTATLEEKKILAKFSGYGGGLIDPKTGQKGSAYEYYTPKPIAEGVWDVLGQLGFAGGKVLDPSAGTGIFGATAPLNAAIDAVELSEQSGMVNKLVNEGPGYTATISSFEKMAANTPDEVYDAIVTNVPFGNAADRGMNKLDDIRYRDEPLENYFILRSLEKLRPNGLAAFIVPTRCVSGKGGKPEELRREASWMAEFVGAYRLPTGTFSTANTDTVTDIIFFRKYSEEAATKIQELREQNPILLSEANVIWDTFIDGKYFDSTEGKKYVIGEFQARDPEKFRDVDKVIYNGDLNAIRNELKNERQLPKSRIDWALLETAETTPIVYHEGDVITQAGVTLKMHNGVWEALPKSAPDLRVEDLLARSKTALTALTSNLTYEEANELRQFLLSMSRFDDIPAWLGEFSSSWNEIGWNRAVVAMAVQEVLADHRGDVGFNYLENFSELSEAMQHANISKSSASKTAGELKIALTVAYNHYNRKQKFSAFWKGEVRKDARSEETLAAQDTPEAKLSRLRYETQSEWVSLEKVKEILGEEFDPLTSTEWCISADGKSVCKTADYYVGNYAQFLDRINAEIEAAKDERIRDRLIRQKIEAATRVRKVNVDTMKFNMFTPGVTPEEKVDFLKRFVSEDAFVTSVDGRTVVDIDVHNPKTDRDKLLNRLGDYLQKRTLTVGTVRWDYGMDSQVRELEEVIRSAREKGVIAASDEKKLAEINSQLRKKALDDLRLLVAETNAQFNSWMHANPTIMDRLRAVASDPTKLRFIAEDDSSEIAIPGMQPSLKLHGHQAAYVRQMGREFSGINGFGVGLGKTFTALAAVQHVHAIGAKKKTLFVVPNSVLSNWYKEAKKAYSSIDDCLFVGLREDKNGKMNVNSNRYVEDLLKIKENNHSKIFLTMEAFAKIKIQKPTLDEYAEYLSETDAEYQRSMSKKEDEANQGKLAKMLANFLDPDNAAPSIEELGIDSIVVDEAHAYKNSSEAHKFASAKYLSLSAASKRGIDAQIKCWYVRGRSAKGDGVLMLTATPITNSPLEIYSMLSLAVGAERVNESALLCDGTDSFLSAICKTDNQPGLSIAGQPKNESVFVGLENVDILRQAVGQVITAKSAKDVGAKVHIPEREEKATSVDLDAETIALIETYKNAYIYASETLKQKGGKSYNPEIIGNQEMAMACQSVMSRFGEPLELIGRPFNLIQKMTTAIDDPEFDTRSSFYSVWGTSEQVEELVTEFNSLPEKSVRAEVSRLNPRTEAEDVLKTKMDDDGKPESYVVRVRAYAGVPQTNEDGEFTRVELTTIDPGVQTVFEKLAEKKGLNLTVTIPVKLAAMLKNYQDEMAHPRGLISESEVSPIVKQIVFCDTLALHNKIKRVISQKAGVPASKIAIITGKINNEPEEIIDVQDGFNAQGEENRYQCIIANEKAEVGINLQKGTQAIHHLTIGWTPDSIEQRNGRGARQGNQTEKVTIYYYDANGTFDQIKRAMVNHKSNWIEKVLGGSDTEVDIEGGMSTEMQERIALADGSKESIERIQAEQAAQEKAARIERVRFEQRTNLKTIMAQRTYLANNSSVAGAVAQALAGAWNLYQQLVKIEKGIENDIKKNAAQKTIDKKRAAHKNLSNQFKTACARIDSSAEFEQSDYYSSKTVSAAECIAAMGATGANDTKVREAISRLGSYSRAYVKSETYEMNVKDGGVIANEWQANQDEAKALIAGAVAEYQKSVGKEGAFAGVIAERMAESGGIFTPSGIPVVKGTVYYKLPDAEDTENANNFIVLVFDPDEGSTAQKLQVSAYFNSVRDRFYNDVNVDATGLRSEGFLNQGDPGYEDALRKMAEVEDGHIPYEYFSKAIPEVSQYRKSVKQVAYSRARSLLPPPNFPYILNWSDSQKGEVMKAIFESQKALINGWDRYGDDFYVDEGVEVLEASGDALKTDNITQAFVDYASAHNMRLSYREYSGTNWLNGIKTNITQTYMESSFDFNEAVTSSDTDEAWKQMTEALEKAIPYFAFNGLVSWELSYVMPEEFINEFHSHVRQIRTGATGSAFEGVDESAKGHVTGRAMSWRMKIMEASADADGNSTPRWTGDAFIITLKAWKLLTQRYPGAADELKFSLM